MIINARDYIFNFQKSIVPSILGTDNCTISQEELAVALYEQIGRLQVEVYCI